jgi:hypothetical protein
MQHTKVRMSPFFNEIDVKDSFSILEYIGTTSGMYGEWEADDPQTNGLFFLAIGAYILWLLFRFKLVVWILLRLDSKTHVRFLHPNVTKSAADLKRNNNYKMHARMWATWGGTYMANPATYKGVAL